MTIQEIGTIGGLVEFLVEQGVKVGVAAEIIAKAFGWGVDSARFRAPENLVAPQIKVTPAGGQLSLIEEVPKAKREPKKAAHRIPEDFAMTPAHRSFAAERAFSLMEIESMWLKFKNHYLGNTDVSPDWSAKWRTWVMRSVEYKNRDSGNSPNRNRIDDRL